MGSDKVMYLELLILLTCFATQLLGKGSTRKEVHWSRIPIGAY